MRLVRNAIGIASLFGIDLKTFARAWPGIIWYLAQKRTFEAQCTHGQNKSFLAGKLRPCLADRFAPGGTASGMYFHQDLIVAQLIFAARPKRHVDVGSRVDGFVAHVAVFCEIEVIDIRRIVTSARNITFRQADIMQNCRELDGCTDSLSCLNALEHFGLGRYGDPIDCDGHRKGFGTLARMVVAGGRFYFAVPISKSQRFEFNAHRVFSMPYLLALFGEFGFAVRSFHYVDDHGEMQSWQDHTSPLALGTYGLHFGCGIFELEKLGT
jgi:hypothetical protein